MGFLSGKRVLIVGVASKLSIASGIAAAMHREGAELAFTYQNEKLKGRVEEFAAGWGSGPELCFPCDVADDAEIEQVFVELAKKWDGLDCIVHSVGFAPGDQLDGNFAEVTTREGFRIAHDISAYSFVALAKAGRDTELGTDLCIGYSTHIAETEEKAISEARPFFEENMKMFAPLGFVRGLSDEQMSALAQGSAKARSANLPTVEDGVKAGSWLCGPAELVTEKLLDVQSRYPGLEVVNIGSPVGTPQKVILEQLERFAKEVMPAFKK